ncbi:MAG TPA: hypothetical protein VHC90_11390 [Bryobacteraceae bacterium]|nr:hypothetical protein [Bryobacteraceae bacterium]
MSLYAHLEIHTGMQMAPISEELTVYGWLTLIFRKAGCEIEALNGVLGEQAAPVLQDAVVNIDRLELIVIQDFSREVFDAAKTFLSRLLADCKAHPKAVLSVQN